jgi:hypothetical protein
MNWLVHRRLSLLAFVAGKRPAGYALRGVTKIDCHKADAKSCQGSVSLVI